MSKNITPADSSSSPSTVYRLRHAVSAPRLLLALLVLVYFVYFGLYAVGRHAVFETGAFDLGVYSQPLWNYLHGNDFAVSIQDDNGPLRWANHVEPILFLILPIYSLWPDPRTLLWLQVAGLSLAGVPLYALATRRLHSEWAALAVVLTFYLLPATEAVTLFDFHAVAFAPLLLLSALYFLDKALTAQGHSLFTHSQSPNLQSPISPSSKLPYFLSALFFLLALSTKEDISLHVLMIGVYLLVLRRRWREGTVLVAVGAVWFYVTFQVVIPHFRTGGNYSIFISWFEELGRTPLEIALSPLRTPDKVIALLFRPDRLPPLAMLTVPQALLPWAGLPFFLMAAPSLAFSLLSDNPTTRQLETWHYAAPMLAFVMLATLDGLARVRQWLVKPGRHTAWLKSAPVWLLLLVSLTYHILRGYSHLSLLPEWPQPTAHHRLGQAIAQTIPPDASVLAQAHLVPHVAHRYRLKIWSGPLLTDFDYIWLDLSHPRFPNRSNAHGDLLTGMIIEPTFGPVAAQDGFLLLQKGAPRDPLPASLFTFTRYDTLPPDARPVDAVFGDTLRLVAVKPDVRRLATSETEPQMVLYFEVLRPLPEEDYNLFVYLLDEQGQVVGATDHPQPAMFWWPTSRWQAGDRRQVRVNTVPWWTGDRTVFSYAVGLSRSEDPWNAAARLPVRLEDTSPRRPGLLPVEGDTILPVVTFRRFAGIPYPGR